MTTCTGAVLKGPALGARLMKLPYFGLDNVHAPIPCTVVYVNDAHGYYTVLFDSGYRQAFRFGA